jgi:aldose sugar dehydrogenase
MKIVRSCNNLNPISVRFGEDRILVSSSSFLKTVVFLVLIVILSTTDSNILSPSPTMSQIAIAANATITKIQVPGIIPNNNDFSNTSNVSSNNNNPPPPPITHNTRARPSLTGPTLNDPNLKVEQIINRGFDDPTSMAFLGPNDILVLEKNTGKVLRILNGKILPEPLIVVNVANQAERGLLGIAIANNGNSNNIVIPGITSSTNTFHLFLYYTESGGGKDGDDAPLINSSTIITSTGGSGAVSSASGNIPPAGNRLYRYDIDINDKLINPLLLLNLPASAPPERAGTQKNHNGGKVLIGPDNKVYVGIGDVGGHRGQAENNLNGIAPDGTGGILRVTQDGKVAANSPLGNTLPLALYYAYGIRNTFGMDFDPITGNLWDTENGNTFGDEINLVKPGFNSGWSQVAGIWKVLPGSKPGPAIGADSNNPPKGLVTLDGKGTYRAPEFTWLQTIAPTVIKFFNSDKLGKQYENTIFVGDVDYGRLYNFKLNEDRTGLVLPSDGPLADKIANTPDQMTQQLAGGVTIGQGFGVITDLQVGPNDGYLYILTLNGSLYRIIANSSSSQ